MASGVDSVRFAFDEAHRLETVEPSTHSSARDKKVFGQRARRSGGAGASKGGGNLIVSNDLKACSGNGVAYMFSTNSVQTPHPHADAEERQLPRFDQPLP